LIPGIKIYYLNNFHLFQYLFSHLAHQFVFHFDKSQCYLLNFHVNSTFFGQLLDLVLTILILFSKFIYIYIYIYI
jgi:hypothetical protein